LFDNQVYHAKFFKTCQKQNAVREAFRFMRLLSKPSLSSYNLLLCVCRDARDVDGKNAVYRVSFLWSTMHCK
jgi:hypothetical protein